MHLQIQFFKGIKPKLTTLLLLFSIFGGLLLSGLSSLSVAQAAVPSTVVGWGYNSDGETNVPAGLNNVTAIAAGTSHSLALKSDGTVVGWGDNDEGQLNIPGGLSNVTAIAAGYHYSLALKNDGTVVGWGDNSYGQINTAGLSNVTAISAAYFHSLALKSDGTVVAWGSNTSGESTVPAGLSNVTAIAAGYYHSLALKSDGTVVAWGDNGDGQSNTTGLSNVTAISAGVFHSLALKSDGTVVAWGYNNFGQSAVPAGLSNVTAISAGGYHSLALKSDGTVVGWSRNNYGENTTPAGLSGFTAIAGGYGFSLGIYTDGTPPTTSASTSPTSPNGTNGWFKSNVTVNLSATDNSGGSGVKSITYSLNNGTPVTVNAASTSVTITSAGTTSLSYYAIDNNGNKETTKTLSIKLDKTAPAISASAKKADGSAYTPGSWTSQNVTVNFSCSDATSGLNGSCPTDQTFSSDGTYTATGSISDLAGNSNSATLSVKIDKTAPTVTASAKTATTNQPYTAGTWTNQNVIVSFSCSDATSGIASGACPASVTVSTEGSTPSVSGSVSDLAGNTNSASFGPILIDKTAPSVTATPDRAPDSNGWYNKSVTFSFGGNDGSGSGSLSCDAAKSYSGPDSLSASVTGNCTDAAGNSASGSASFKYDATKPTVSYSGNAGTYTVDQIINITCAASDNLSGIASTTCANISGPASSFAPGTNSFSATATDQAGNTGSGSTSFTVSVTFDSLCTLSRQFSTKSDVAQGLCDKLAAAKAAAAAGDTKTKNNILNAYRNQLSAQSGKALTKQQATLLTNLSKAL